MTIEDRFWSRVDKQPCGCWIWTGCRTKGYGQAYIPFKGRKKGKMILAHRRAWELIRGPIPEGYDLLHNCPHGDNKLCVNPDHLYLGDHLENMKDTAKKKQMPHGEKHPHRKLTDLIVTVVRLKLGMKSASVRELAWEYRVSEATIRSAWKRKTWAHI